MLQSGIRDERNGRQKDLSCDIAISIGQSILLREGACVSTQGVTHSQQKYENIANGEIDFPLAPSCNCKGEC